jgi:integrase
MNLSEYMRDYNERKAHNFTASTNANRKAFAVRIAKVIGGLDIAAVKPRDLDILDKSLYESNMCTERSYKIKRFLDAVLADARKNDETKYQFEPPAALRRPARELKQFLDQSTIDRIINHAQPQFKSLFKFLQLTGCRPGEAMALRWEDVDYTQRIISIHATVSYGEVGKTTKTGVSRNIFITPGLLRLLKEIDRAGGFIFTDLRGNNYRYTSNINRAWKLAIQAAGLDITHVSYTLRHSFASKMLSENASLAAVSKIIGHSNTSTTSKYYIGSTDELDQQTNALMQRVYQ